jgi:hypothetical protein
MEFLKKPAIYAIYIAFSTFFPQFRWSYVIRRPYFRQSGGRFAADLPFCLNGEIGFFLKNHPSENFRNVVFYTVLFRAATLVQNKAS